LRAFHEDATLFSCREAPSAKKEFTPTVMCSDTWPHKKEHWEKLIPNVQGRLGLFHYEKRMLSTLRKKHVDFQDAVSDLLDALHEYESNDYENLLTALKNGAITGKQHTTTETSQLQQTKHFRKRFGKCLRKRLREPNTMIQRLDDWFCKHKVTASENARLAGGRLDPFHNIPLFTPDTKPAVENCKEKAIHLADPMNIEQMYDKMPPNPNSKHQLTECVSKRGESKLESFHNRLAHCANSGMRNSLSDNLHLAGTARHNLGIRHKRRLLTLENTSERSRVPAAWEKIVPCWNHSELQCVNELARDAGSTQPPFPNAELLPQDNGERFFSQHITTVNPRVGKHGVLDECLCGICTKFDDNIGDASTPATQLLTSPAGPTLTTHETQPPVAVRQQQQQQIISPPIRTPPHHQPQPQPTFFQQPHWQMPILPMPVFYMPQPTTCCTKHFNWMMQKRKGRPPHDCHCRNRGNSKTKFVITDNCYSL